MRLERYTPDGGLVETRPNAPDQSPEQTNADALSDRAVQAIATLEDAWSKRGAGAPPVAVQWLTVRVVIALARLVLGRLEAS